jgi:ATP-dependent helicase HrpA
VAPELQEDITDWDFGELAEIVEIRRGGQTLVGFPGAGRPRRALRARGVRRSAAGAREAPRRPAPSVPPAAEGAGEVHRQVARAAADRAMQAGTVPALAAALPGFEALRGEVVDAALDRTALAEPWPTDRASFLARRDETAAGWR